MASPKTKKRKLAGPAAKLAKMMRGIDLCMLTTHGSKDSLHTRPMSNNGEVAFDGDAWFFTSKSTRKVKEIVKNPRVSLSYVGGTKTKPVWIAVSGSARIVTDEATKKELWLEELERWFENGPEDPDVVLIHVSAQHAEWWSYTDQGEADLR